MSEAPFLPASFVSYHGLILVATVLAIPIYLIWTAKLRASQKLALAFSLCLTALLIVFTLIRPASMRTANSVIDVTWASFWQYVSAEVGIILTAIPVFRTFLVRQSRQSRSPHRAWYSLRPGAPRSSSQRPLRISPAQIKGPLTATSSGATETSVSRISQPSGALARGFDSALDHRSPIYAAPRTPRMTGVHTVIVAAGGRASRVFSRFMGDEGRADEIRGQMESHDGPWQPPGENAITVEHQFDSYSIRWKKSEADLRQEE